MQGGSFGGRLRSDSLERHGRVAHLKYFLGVVYKWWEGWWLVGWRNIGVADRAVQPREICAITPEIDRGGDRKLDRHRDIITTSKSSLLSRKHHN